LLTVTPGFRLGFRGAGGGIAAFAMV